MLGLAIDNLAGPLDLWVPVPLETQHVDGRPDGSQGIAQLVGEHRQKFVLLAIGPFQVFVKVCVLQRHRGPRAQGRD